MLNQNIEFSGLSIANASFGHADEIFAKTRGILNSSDFTIKNPDFLRRHVENSERKKFSLIRQIIDAFLKSKGGYSFGSWEDFAEEIAFRLHSIDAMTFCNTGHYDVDYFDPDINLLPRLGSIGESRLSQYWSFLHPKQEWDAEFSQSAGTIASDAVAPILGNTLPFRGECAGAFQMAVYFGLLTGLGAKRFDEMAAQFGRMYIGPWSLPGNKPNPATLYMQRANLSDPPIPGDYMYFKNKDDYLKWAPNGFWTGLNAMYMGEDALGTRHYAGMGASWLSETNLRAALVNAYYHDCSPHTISDPSTEVRFTERFTLTIPTDLQVDMAEDTRTSGEPSGATAGGTAPPPTAAHLKSAGFTESDGGVFHHPGTTLGALAKTIGFHPDEVQQVASAGLANPSQRVTKNGVATVISYDDPHADRRDPNAAVTAHLNLNVGQQSE